ncbi:MtnX-like HAD-IB family phosphatase [Pigmentiphaga soli]|uniref:MtnX-like HAD-IB family phosphatase n=1 Tax=Pigmentiphaga soli TaxID=1007095 RepID=A0ABP8H932_9BURK
MNDDGILRAQPRASTGWGWTIQCDFDGTISVEDVTDMLLGRFGMPGWQALETAWERGEIGSRACMQGQVALLDMGAEELDAQLRTVEIDPSFPDFVAAAQELGIAVQVVSDGLDRAIRDVLGRHGLGHLPVIANRLLPAGGRRWRLESPWASPACARASGNCKCERLAEQQAVRGRVLYVGDGSSDFCVSGKADLVLAKHRLIDHCRAHAIAHVPFADFREALALLPTIVGPRALEPAA